jgi:hypothetical protein
VDIAIVDYNLPDDYDTPWPATIDGERTEAFKAPAEVDLAKLSKDWNKIRWLKNKKEARNA